MPSAWFDEATMFVFEDVEVVDQLLATPGQACPSTPLAAHHPFDEGLAGQVVHEVDGIPGGLVAHADGPGCLRDGTAFGNLGKQADAPLAAEIRSTDRHPDGAVQFYGMTILFFCDR